MAEPVSTITAIISIGSFLGGLFGGGSSKKKRKKRRQARIDAAVAAERNRLALLLPPIITPTPPQVVKPRPLPRVVTQIFKRTGEAAIIGKAARAAKLGGLGGLIIIAADILSKVVEKKQLRSMGDILRRQDVDIADRQLKRAREKRQERARAEVIFPSPFPATTTTPRVQPTPKTPAKTRPRLPLPEIGPPIPGRVGTQPRPRVATPQRVPALPVPSLPGTKPTTRPATVPKPATRPVRLPSIRLPFPFPSIGFPLPSRAPRIRLTTPKPTVIPSPDLRPGSQIDPQFATPLPQPTQPPQTAERKCEEVKRRRRRKGKCREGFFRERPDGTQFTTWRERPCL